MILTPYGITFFPYDGGLRLRNAPRAIENASADGGATVALSHHAISGRPRWGYCRLGPISGGRVGTMPRLHDASAQLGIEPGRVVGQPGA